MNETIEIEVSFIDGFMDFKLTNSPTYETDCTKIKSEKFVSLFILLIPAGLCRWNWNIKHAVGNTDKSV